MRGDAHEETVMAHPSAAAREKKRQAAAQAARVAVHGGAVTRADEFCSFGDLCPVCTRVVAAFAAARVAAERERCARIAGVMNVFSGAGAPRFSGAEIAAALRAPEKDLGGHDGK